MENLPEKLRYFEDFEEGLSWDYSVPGLASYEVIEFTTQYDPQRFHLDENEAAKTHFGGLIASGFQTVLLCFKPFCESILKNANAMGAPGIDTLKWKRPWYPGETLDVNVTLANKHLSSGRNDRGYLNFKMNAYVNGKPTLVMEWMVIILTKDSANK